MLREGIEIGIEVVECRRGRPRETIIVRRPVDARNSAKVLVTSAVGEWAICDHLSVSGIDAEVLTRVRDDAQPICNGIKVDIEETAVEGREGAG